MSINNILNQYNKGTSYVYDTEVERQYTNLSELYQGNGEQAEYPVEALFINKKSKFGDAPVIVSGGYLVNAPSHLTETVVEMRGNQELTELINERKVGFTIYEYENQYGKRHSLNWCELK